ncbi:hypothetical protein Lepto7376_0860 [[Leptolyngbya] sp. PCC 7376]|uniref:hypothetical protein n=1 Tax=[Leptolyngbya] sp. PCC 7376 TaxID=111781 RepID=UPI00029ECB41|nr:hypothetical protein [[Leptolyngbya] sp. PCC 7376]AFY37255.1 hypothetical protein Lepto7376_0860 [[Leptolyngbya] sp. PCC 7376]
MTPEIFRQQYPQGGLVSELAAIEHGQYVVRVLVQNDGVTLTSGLAAAASVEHAEDQARARALGLLVSGSRAASKPASVQPAIAPPTIPVPSPTAVPIKQPTVTKPVPVAAPKAEFTYDLPLSAPPELEPEPIIEPSAPATTTSAAPAVEEPLDFSDIIARSDVELKRLGWTSEQGRNYLLETYGKRSRQLLSDAELLEFLRFLEGQPSP